ncbi:MAG: hypothetical protein ACRD0U_20335 [Acidimicrobiales bacterium]
MTTTRRFTIAAVAAAVALGGVAAGASGADTNNRRTITVIEPAGEGSETWLDLGSTDSGPGQDIGDLLVEHKPLIEPNSHEPAGTIVARFQISDVIEGNPIFLADGTVRLERGDLTFYGTATFSDFETGATFAVTGGTADYTRAAGTATFSITDVGVLIQLKLTKR